MYIADLHLHSRFARATGHDITPEVLDLWGRRKGIGLLGTADFTHPVWRSELKERLRPAEDGFYVLKDEYRIRDGSADGAPPVRFVVTGEISSIYKQGGRVRKVHSLLILPGFEDADRISARLEQQGFNLHSDGRPILGLSCRDLLELSLEESPREMFVPAHIWTPHFSVFGAFSGFDSMEECFGDLTGEIHAVETGLSTDPPMNWRLSALDGLQLLSNSDAHSAPKLGREANVFSGEFSYEGLKKAVETGDGLEKTIEFFPEEGKYHMDGHRKCHLCMTPAETAACGGICPVCGKKITIGVAHRIEELADRPEGYVKPDAKPFESLMPLPEVIGSSMGVSPQSVKAQRLCGELLSKLGSEFSILRELPEEEIRQAAGSAVAEGIRRLRAGQVIRRPGYDGEYGVIRLFDEQELENTEGQLSLFLPEEKKEQVREQRPETEKIPTEPENQKESGEKASAFALNAAQQEAVISAARALMVIAGPGTGKTGTLTERILYLLTERGVRPSEITAVTFTTQAAKELKERIAGKLGSRRESSRMQIGTFHSICMKVLKAAGFRRVPAEEELLSQLADEAAESAGFPDGGRKLLRRISAEKAAGIPGWYRRDPEPENPYEKACCLLRDRMQELGICDFDDLLLEMLLLLEKEKKNEYRKNHFAYLLVDEFQDVNPVQLALTEAWNRDGRELFAIGDPDQSVYGFRGTDSACFERLRELYPEIRTIVLEENYRSSPSILRAAGAVISANPGGERTLIPVRKPGEKVRLVTAAGSMEEAVYAAHEIGRMVGGTDLLDTGSGSEDSRMLGFSDIAVLYRTHRQAAALEKCLLTEGIPYRVAGREDFLSDETVRGTIGFFRSILEPGDRYGKKLALQLFSEPGAEAAYEKAAEEYLPLLAKKKAAFILLRWFEERGAESTPETEAFLQMACLYKTVGEMLEALTFGTEGDLLRPGKKEYRGDAVTLMTLHASKGREFPAVILCGVRKGLIPLEFAPGAEEKLSEETKEEERRLLYVGMTRAKERLILMTGPEPSEFLKGIPEEELLRQQSRERRDEMRQLSLFDWMKQNR